ncbi:MAG TPA: alpha/beta hydrolase [Solirubrobacterales bacterium]|jgi:pimeloyl-ACP methyl ester carboxylesterase
MRLPCDETGEGPAVLLLHAGVADRRMWAEHLEPLAAAGRRVVAVDLPGFGEAVGAGPGPVAQWEDVLETMDALGIGEAALVGSSFGAQVALRVAALHPQRVSALLLFSVAAVPEPEPSPQLLAAWEGEEEAVAAGDHERAVAAVLAGWVRPEASDAVRERVATMQRENYERHAAEPEPEQAPDPLEQDPARLAGIACAVLLAVGESDMTDFRQAATELAGKLPRARTTVIAGCGHLAPLEAPAEFRRLVISSLP